MSHNYNEQKNDFESLIPYVSARVPNADDLSVEHALRQAVMQFMKDSYLFKGQTVFYGQSGVDEYILEIPEEHVIYDIASQGVRHRERPVPFERDGTYDVIRLHRHHHMHRHHHESEECYTVDYYYHIRPDACEVPDAIFTKYLNTVVSKAIVLLYTGEEKSYVTASLYQIAQQEYASDLDMINVRRVHNFSQGRPRMRSPRGDRGYFR